MGLVFCNIAIANIILKQTTSHWELLAYGVLTFIESLKLVNTYTILACSNESALKLWYHEQQPFVFEIHAPGVIYH